MEDDKLKKQEYLKNEILNGGLDQNAFVQYLNDIKGEGKGTNVDNWEMDELVEVRYHFIDNQVVADFKKSIGMAVTDHIKERFNSTNKQE